MRQERNFLYVKQIFKKSESFPSHQRITYKKFKKNKKIKKRLLKMMEDTVTTIHAHICTPHMYVYEYILNHCL